MCETHELSLCKTREGSRTVLGGTLGESRLPRDVGEKNLRVRGLDKKKHRRREGHRRRAETEIGRRARVERPDTEERA